MRVLLLLPCGAAALAAGVVGAVVAGVLWLVALILALVQACVCLPAHCVTRTMANCCDVLWCGDWAVKLPSTGRALRHLLCLCCSDDRDDDRGYYYD